MKRENPIVNEFNRICHKQFHLDFQLTNFGTEFCWYGRQAKKKTKLILEIVNNCCCLFLFLIPFGPPRGPPAPRPPPPLPPP